MAMMALTVWCKREQHLGTLGRRQCNIIGGPSHSNTSMYTCGLFNETGTEHSRACQPHQAHHFQHFSWYIRLPNELPT